MLLLFLPSSSAFICLSPLHFLFSNLRLYVLALSCLSPVLELKSDYDTDSDTLAGDFHKLPDEDGAIENT